MIYIGAFLLWWLVGFILFIPLDLIDIYRIHSYVEYKREDLRRAVAMSLFGPIVAVFWAIWLTDSIEGPEPHKVIFTLGKKKDGR